MTPRMKPITDADGNLRPDLDRRDVPLAVMAQYAGMHAKSLYALMLSGDFPKQATVKHHTRTYYKPWVWVQIRERVVSA